MSEKKSFPIVRFFIILISLLIILILVGTWQSKPVIENFFSPKSDIDGVSLKIVSGSENQTLEPLIEEFNQETGAKVEMSYLGSVDILIKMNENQTEDIDAVWPASSLVLSLTDNLNLKHQKSILRSPVILGIKRNIAENLGWTSLDSITVQMLLNELQDGNLKMAMTNATQSNSGLSGYLAFLQAFSGDQEVLDLEDLNNSEVQAKTRALLNSVNRSSGSSGWLKDLFLEKYDSLDAMLNYESVIIETNQELEKQNKTPLQAVYISDGMVVADSPLAYLDKKQENKEKAFLMLQEFLTSEKTTANLLASGRRSGVGLNVDISQNNLSSVFRSEWGIIPDIPFVSLRIPKKEVIEEMLNLYQISLRKPSFTVYVVDVSGSMEGQGLEQLKEAMETIVNQNTAKKYFLQASKQDVSIVIPFNSQVGKISRFEGNSSETLRDFNITIDALEAGGGTDMYTPLILALDLINSEPDINKYFPAVILLSDGRSQNQGKIENLRQFQDTPIFPIMFGQAEKEQLEEIVQITTGRVFDGREDLVEAFRNAKGYN